MKTVKYLAAILITASLARAASAQTAAATVQTPVASASPTASAPPANLAFGVSQVLKLQQAGLGNDVLVNYVNGSTDSFALRADDIVYLHNSGVPQDVINAMINKQKNQTVVAQNPAPAPAPTYTQQQQQQVAPPDASANVGSTTTVVTQPPTVVTQPPVVYTSPTYVYPSYPYYGSPYYYGPSISLGFGWGGHGWYGGHGYYGGWHGGGWHGGGGWHHH